MVIRDGTKERAFASENELIELTVYMFSETRGDRKFLVKFSANTQTRLLAF